MNYRDILVHIDCAGRCDSRLDLAISIARRHKALLTGISVITHAYFAPLDESEKLRQAAAEQLFRQKCAAAGIENEWLGIDWPVVGTTTAEILNAYSHAKDLIIIGQAEGKEKGVSDLSDLPERLILGSGRPVLVVPFTGEFKSVGERVILAWRSGRASARAVHDAIPLLLNAGQINLLAIRPIGEKKPVEIVRQSDICSHLARYGINVKEENLVTGDISIANILMNYAWENGCDLIVMGAYSQNPRGTHNIGPVAEYLLEHMTLPILFSH